MPIQKSRRSPRKAIKAKYKGTRKQHGGYRNTTFAKGPAAAFMRSHPIESDFYEKAPKIMQYTLSASNPYVRDIEDKLERLNRLRFALKEALDYNERQSVLDERYNYQNALNIAFFNDYSDERSIPVCNAKINWDVVYELVKFGFDPRDKCEDRGYWLTLIETPFDTFNKCNKSLGQTKDDIIERIFRRMLISFYYKKGLDDLNNSDMQKRDQNGIMLKNKIDTIVTAFFPTNSPRRPPPPKKQSWWHW